MNKHKLLILAGKGVSTDILYNSLKEDYDIEAVVIEKPVPRSEFLRKRIRKLGIRKVLGQVLFQFVLVPLLNRLGAGRRKEILLAYHLDTTPVDGGKILTVDSVNSRECIECLKKTDAEAVIVNGTRIISREVLQATGLPFINIHAGITPKYRNVHGAYWALVNNDAEHCGVTVHLVDPGIDTGKIIYQQLIAVTGKDSFVTYPLLQVAEGVLCLKKALTDLFTGHLTFTSSDLPSKLWYHPTLWQYIYNRLVHKKR